MCEIRKSVRRETREKLYATAKNGGDLNSFRKLIVGTSMRETEREREVLTSLTEAPGSFFSPSRSHIFNGDCTTFQG